MVAVSSGAMICSPKALTQAVWLEATSEVTIRKVASWPGFSVISLSGMCPAKSVVVRVA